MHRTCTRQSLFLQVKVPPGEADALYSLWWEDADFCKPPEENQMVSHIFGVKDSPSCADYCLKRAADDNKEILSEEAVKSIQKDFYIDDLLICNFTGT